jgi:O-antigen/teichoic acid export membrane protein
VFLNLLARVKREGLVRDATHLSIAQGLRLFIQAAYFVLIARSLGPDSYGTFVTLVAMAGVLGPFSGMGTPNLFIKNVRSGKREAAVCWGNGLLLTVLSGTLFSVLMVATKYIVHLSTGLFGLVIVCISDLIFVKVTELAAFGFAASNRMKDTSILTVIVSLLRLIGIAVMVVVLHKVSLQQWTLVYLLTSVLGTLYVLFKGTQLWGRPRIQLTALREDVGEGVFFSIGSSATTVYNDIDKVMLSKLSDFASTGIYGAAYRIIDVSMSPVRSLVGAAYPEFFRRGVNGMNATYRYARSLISKSIIFGAVTFFGLWLCAPVLPHILGHQYEAAIPALRWLALIPFLRCIHVFLGDALSGAGFQRTRTGIQVFIALVNVGLNLLILPRYSWRGAAWTSLGCDAMLMALFWTAVLYHVRQESRMLSPSLVARS